MQRSLAARLSKRFTIVKDDYGDMSSSDEDSDWSDDDWSDDEGSSSVSHSKSTDLM